MCASLLSDTDPSILALSPAALGPRDDAEVLLPTLSGVRPRDGADAWTPAALGPRDDAEVLLPTPPGARPRDGSEAFAPTAFRHRDDREAARALPDRPLTPPFGRDAGSPEAASDLRSAGSQGLGAPLCLSGHAPDMGGAPR